MRGLWPVALLLSTFVACANDARVVKVPKNETQFSVSLVANPSTGYQWSIKQYNTSVLKLASSQYVASGKNLAGSGGKMYYVFNIVPGAKLPATTSIEFVYARPWDPTTGTSTPITVEFLGAK